MKTKKAKVKKIIIPTKYFIAVATGIKWLDITLGRKVWLKRMDMSKFDITAGYACVAGNVFKEAMGQDGWSSFEEGMDALGLKGTKAGERLGFYCNNEKGYQYLQDIWVAAIKKLKKQARAK